MMELPRYIETSDGKRLSIISESRIKHFELTDEIGGLHYSIHSGSFIRISNEKTCPSDDLPMQVAAEEQNKLRKWLEDYLSNVQ